MCMGCSRALEVGVDQCAALAGHMDRASLRGSGKVSSVLAEMLEAVLVRGCTCLTLYFGAAAVEPCPG